MELDRKTVGKMILSKLLKSSIYMRMFVILVIYSLFVLWMSSELGLYSGKEFKGYAKSFNWSLYFLFWALVIPFVRATWNEFVSSWKSLVDEGMVQKANGNPEPNILDSLNNEFVRHRKLILIPISIVLAIVVMAIDTGELRDIYYDEISIDEFSERDWTVAWLLESDAIHTKSSNAIFIILAYIQQFVIIMFGFIALLQIWYHVWLFHRPDILKSIKENNLKLSLDPYSNLREFGLERWNQAINSIYWWLAIALLVPIVSRASQGDGPIDFGQVMINWLVPLLFLSPMLFTIIARQKKMEAVWDIVRNEKSTGKVDLFHKQLLWPLDKNWASKLGIILAFALLSYLIGDILENFGNIKF